MQARIMGMLPIVFTFFLATFPAGLVLYWTWNNLLSIAQQWTIMKRMEKQLHQQKEHHRPALPKTTEADSGQDDRKKKKKKKQSDDPKGTADDSGQDQPG
jgi:membrane protein insertase Oxa1/YidC/SpoIIIJ